MSQTRVYNFGDTLTQSKTKTQASKLLSAGVYEGMNPIITGPATLNLSPGAFLLPNGILVSESTAITSINYPPSWPPGLPIPPAATTDFTLTADHDDVQAIGGSAVSYNLRPGIFPRFGSPLPNSVALLWIRHPGSASIDPGMFSLPPKVKNGALQNDLALLNGWMQAPFSDACDVVAGPNIVQQKVSFPTGPQNTGLMLQNTAIFNDQSFAFSLPIPRFPWARRVAVYADLPATASIAFNQLQRTVAAPAAAGLVTVTVNDVSGFVANDRVLFRDPVSGIRQIAVVANVLNATQFQATLSSPINIGTLMTSLCVVTAETGDILSCTPTSITGPASGLGPIPAGAFNIASGPKPATLGIKITVPASSAVFLKGFQFLGD